MQWQQIIFITDYLYIFCAPHYAVVAKQTVHYQDVNELNVAVAISLPAHRLAALATHRYPITCGQFSPIANRRHTKGCNVVTYVFGIMWMWLRLTSTIPGVVNFNNFLPTHTHTNEIITPEYEPQRQQNPNTYKCFWINKLACVVCRSVSFSFARSSKPKMCN